MFSLRRESTLSVLKERLALDYYPLRAAICDHLLEPIYSPDDTSLTEEEAQATIRACCGFLNREQPSFFLQQIQKESNKDPTGPVPVRILSPRYPLITHLSAWLLQDDIVRATELARLMDKHPSLDGLWKDEAYLMIWQHLLRRGILFLDGNHTETSNYIQKRDLLYNGIVNGIGPYGRGSMMDFYQALAQKIWDHGQATPDEKHYVLLACQQTLLRLLLKCRGLGDATVVEFLQKTNWPVAIQELTGIASTDINSWAVKCLAKRNPIPESLLSKNDDVGTIDLNRFLEEDVLPSSTDVEELYEQQATHSSHQLQECPAVVMQLQEEEAAFANEVEHLDVEDQQDAINIDDGEGEDDEEEEEDEEVVEEHLTGEEKSNDNEEEHKVNVGGDDDDDYEVEVVEDEIPLEAGQYNHEDSTAEMDSNDAYDYEEQDESSQVQRSRAQRDDSNHQYTSSEEEDEDDQLQQQEQHQQLAKPNDETHMNRRNLNDNDDHENEGYDTFEGEEDDSGEDSSSDDGDSGAVLIQGSEDEYGHPSALPGNIPQNLEDNSDGRSSDVEQYEHAHEEDSDVDDDDGNRDVPHRIGREDVDDASSCVSEEDGIQEAGNIQAAQIIHLRDVDYIEARDHSSDEEDYHPNMMPAAAVVPQDPIEIIDYSDEENEGDDNETQNAALKIASSPREPQAAENVSRGKHESLAVTQQNEAARAMVSMFDSSKVVVNSSGNLEEASTESVQVYAEQVSQRIEAQNRIFITQELDYQDSNITSNENSERLDINRSGLGERPPADIVGLAYEKETEAVVRNETASTGDDHAIVNEAEQNDEEHYKSSEGQASREDDADSNATDDEEERTAEMEKAETEDVAIGGEFGDTTEEENDVPTSSQANILADADRRADVLRARSGYASQLEEGYEPEDTHGYTEDEVSEAIHTDDEDEERRAEQESLRVEVVELRRKKLEREQHNVRNFSDDMNAADEREEDLGAESSELEETAEARDYAYSPFPQTERDPTTLLEFAQSAQRLHRYGSRSSEVMASPAQESAATGSNLRDHTADKPVEVIGRSTIHIQSVDANTPTFNKNKNSNRSQSQQDGDEDEVKYEETSDNIASAEDDKDVDSTMATESVEMTEDAVDPCDSEELGPFKDESLDEVHDANPDVIEMAEDHAERCNEQKAVNVHLTTEMAIDSNIETQDAMIAEIALPNVAMQGILMDTDSPMQASGFDMDVDESNIRVDDQAMGEGEDEPMESEQLIEIAAPATRELLDHDVQVMMKETMEDEAIAGEGHLESSNTVVADVAMDIQPSTSTEIQLETRSVEPNDEGVEDQNIRQDESAEQKGDIQVEALLPDKDADDNQEECRSPIKDNILEDDQSRDEVPRETAVHSSNHSDEAATKAEESNKKSSDKEPIGTRRSARQKERAERGYQRRSSRRKEVVADSDSEDSQPKAGITEVHMDQETLKDTSSTVLDHHAKSPMKGEGPTTNKDGDDDKSNHVTNPSDAFARGTKKQDGTTESLLNVADVVDASSSTTRTTRGHAVEPIVEDNESVKSATQTNLGRTKKGAVEEDESVASVPRSTRARGKKVAVEDDESAASISATSRGRARKSVAEKEKPVGSVTRTTRGRAQTSAVADDESITSATRTTRGRAKKSVVEDDESITSATRAAGGRAKKPPAEDDESLVSPTRTTRGRATKTVADDDESVASASRTTHGRTTKQAEDEDESVVSATRTTRGRAKKQTEDEDESVVSATRTTRGRAKKQAEDEDESVVSATRSTRGRAKKQAEDEDESVASAPRTPSGRKVKAAEDEDASVASATRSTRGRAKKSIAKEDESLPSATRSTRSRAKKAVGEGDESVASSTPNTPNRRKRLTEDEESVSSPASSSKGARKRSRDDDEDDNDNDSKPSTRGSTRKGLPPRAPTRSSARTRTKK